MTPLSTDVEEESIEIDTKQQMVYAYEDGTFAGRAVSDISRSELRCSSRRLLAQ